MIISVRKLVKIGGVKMFANLRKLRREKKIKAIDIARKMGLKTEGAYYKKEIGVVPFTLTEAKLIADMFDKSIEEVFF